MKRKMSLFVTASMVIASIGSTVPAFASEATLQAYILVLNDSVAVKI